jgi:hypothetical protein
MVTLTRERALFRANHKPSWQHFGGKHTKTFWVLLLAGTMTLSACGGSNSSSNSQNSLTLSGNWQFTMGPPSDGSFLGGLQGGFLLQNGGTVTGAAAYAVSLPQLTFPCNSGSAPITGTISGQNLTLTSVAGTQTFMLTGMLSSDGSTIVGTYTSTAGTAADGSPCGTAQTGLQWSAISVPPITGPIQGSFHSTGGSAGLTNQDFIVSGALSQGENIGASNATVTGTLTFINPTTNLSDYPCFSLASVNGEISGNSVILQIINTDGSIAGQIGAPAGSFGSTGVNPVTFDSVHGGYILHGSQPTYLVATNTCPGGLANTTVAGDAGNICLGLNSTSTCQQPVTLSPAVITFPAQLLGSAATMQTITLTNDSSSTLNGLTLDFSNNGTYLFGGQSDFDGLPSFSETDACGVGGVPTQGQPFYLTAGQSCSITVTFSPQESCPWLPFGNPPSTAGAPPEWCPLAAQAVQVTVNSPMSADNDTTFTVPITGLGLSAIEPSTPELDFGAEEQLSPPEASLPQMLSFTNNSGYPLQILGRVPCVNQTATSHTTLPSPRLANSAVAGLQVVSNDVYQITQDPGTTPPTVFYRCDSDPGTKLPNFQISSDTCTGTLLAPQASCSLQIAYVPQPNTNINSGLDYFLELNTVQCYGAVTSDCEIDSGRFPVELKANIPSLLRMSPSAGLDFGNQAVGKSSSPLLITLLNDPGLANPQPVSFVGKFTVQGNYAEADDCPVTLAPGSSCTLTITFKPSIVGFDQGMITINYSPEPNSAPQVIYLRGTGQ